MCGSPNNRWLVFCVGFLLAGFGLRAQSLEETQSQFLHGQYDEVIAAAQAKVQTSDYDGGWRLLLVKTLLTVGRYADAHKAAVAGLDDFGGSIPLHLLVRETDFYQNDLAGANQQLDEIKYIIERRGRFAQTGENLVGLGQALLMLGVEPKLALENCFQRAYDLDPPVRDAWLAAGQLALDKHDFALAADTFRAGLKKFPDDPNMESGLAHAFETGDAKEMQKALEAALAVNPRHIPSLLLLANYMIDAEKYEEAQKQLDLALAVNPSQPEALAYSAVLADLRNDPAAADQIRAKALQYYPQNPQVDYIIGLKLAQKYRFEEGAAAQRRALDFEPDYLPARRELAEDLLRLGNDDEGWKLAEAAHTQDEYDVTAYNLSTLHQQMEKFTTLTNADFVVHMSAHEAQVYGNRVLDLLGRAKAALCKKYGVELQQPTVVEIFPEQKDFAVRTFGMPGNPGYLGVCFGNVITANSPASQAPNPANWEDVLWHEFCHVVTLNDTRNRMPRWLSEGISVYEERQANPMWGEHMNLAYRETILHGGLTPLGELSGAFLQPKNGESLQFAYYESSLVIEFIVQRFGFETLKQILIDLRNGQQINAAIAGRTVALPKLETQFADFARTLAENLAPNADLEKPPESDTEKIIWEKLHPDNYYLQMEKVRDLMEAKKWAEAKLILESLAKPYSGERRSANPLWLEAVADRNLNDTNGEWALLQKFAAQETDFEELDLRLIELAGARHDWQDESKYAQHLLQINPLISEPYTALAQTGTATGEQDEAIEAYRKLLLLDPPDPVDTHYRLALLLHERGGAENEAKRHVLQALEDAPRYRDAQKLLLEIEAAQITPQKGS
jgi:tetratricopeptide (TPR) repeat protein